MGAMEGSVVLGVPEARVGSVRTPRIPAREMEAMEVEEVEVEREAVEVEREGGPL